MIIIMILIGYYGNTINNSDNDIDSTDIDNSCISKTYDDRAWALLFVRKSLCFNTMPCRHTPLLVHF